MSVQQRLKITRVPLHGVILLNKPLQLSSNQALQKVKWLLRAQKAGHTGTLDPLATGVLPLCFGAATKFSQLHLDADKSYAAVLKLGTTTTTGDAEGEIVQQLPVPAITEQLLAAAQQQFSGFIEQLPPMYSALKKDGKPLYEYARAGETVERKRRRVEIKSLKLELGSLQNGETELKLLATCSKGTYIRTLAEDIGAFLGCGAHLIQLTRTATDPFKLEECISIEQLEDLDEAQRVAKLLPLNVLLENLPKISLDAAEAGRFLTGLRRRVDMPDLPLVQVWGTAPDALLGTGEVKGGELIASRLLNPQEIQQILLQTAV